MLATLVAVVILLSVAILMSAAHDGTPWIRLSIVNCDRATATVTLLLPPHQGDAIGRDNIIACQLNLSTTSIYPP
jgi:hypothetical protein